MKLNDPFNTECDIKLEILTAKPVPGWEVRLNRAMQPLNDKQDVFYVVNTEENNVVIRLWLNDEVQENREKLTFINDVFHEVDVEFKPVRCLSHVHFKELTHIFISIKHKQFDKEYAKAGRKLLKRNICDCAKLISTFLLHLPTWAISKLSS